MWEEPWVSPALLAVKRYLRFLPFGMCLWLWLGSFAAPAFAQATGASTYAGFEGQKVSSVEIATRPQINTVRFEALIKQKAGSPFSMEAIQQSVDALRQTKAFSQIQLSITPEQQGLKVLFILQPAYYVGVVSFPGAEHKFAYTQLLQAVNISQQTPFTKELPDEAEKALLTFLHKNGYFEATVRADTEADDAHLIVNLIFHVDLNRLSRIGELNFEGVPESQVNALRAALDSWWAKVRRKSLRTGQRYSDARIGRSVDFLRSHLREEGRLAPVVRVATTTFHPETNRADLKFQIELGPMFSVRVAGTHVSKGTVKKLVPIFEEDSVDQDLIEEGERNLVSYFQAKGFFDAKIDSRLNRQPDRVDVIYEVNLGSKHKVEAVYFEGNHSFDDHQLAQFVLIKKAHFLRHGKYSNDLVRKSTDALTGWYQNQGFAHVKVDAKIDDFNPQTDITFVISEGPRDRVNAVTVKGNSKPLSALLGGHPMQLGPGKPYSSRAVQTDRNNILAGYLNDGYLNATFQPSTSPQDGNPHLLNVTYTITEGQQTTIRDVALVGAKRSDPAFIRYIAGPDSVPGKPLGAAKLLTAESDLYGLNIFDWVSVESSQPVTTQTDAEVLEKVHEEPRNTIDYGGGIEVIPRSGNVPVGTVALPGLPPIGLGSKYEASQKSFFGPRGSFDFTRRNIFGRAETFTASTVVSRLDQRLNLSFADQHFRGSSWSSLISISGENTTENPVFQAEVAIASFQLQRPLNSKHTKNLILRYDFDRTILSNLQIPDLVLPQDRHVRLSTFSGEFTRDTRDSPLNAHKGTYQLVDFGVTPTLLGSSANFVRFLGQTAFYVPVRPWLTWANNFRLGFAIPFSGSYVPLSQMFFSGGADSLRGFPINGAGPQRPVEVCANPADSSTCTLISVPVGGESLFIFNSEARFPIHTRWTDKLGGVLFYDGGNVYAHVNLPEMWKDYTNTVGIGFRYNTPVGPIRFDIGHNLNHVAGVDATQYFVTLGQSF